MSLDSMMRLRPQWQKHSRISGKGIKELLHNLLIHSAEVDDEITALLNHYSHHHYVSRHSVSILRELSGKINHHISITKDKYGEAELNLKLINASFEFTDLQEGMLSRMVDEKYYDYVLRRLIKVLKIIGALHSDYHLDFSDRITEFYEIVKDNDALKVYAELHGLDVVDLEYGDVLQRRLMI